MDRRAEIFPEPPAAGEIRHIARNEPVDLLEFPGETGHPAGAFGPFGIGRDVGVPVAPQPEEPREHLIVGGGRVVTLAVRPDAARDEARGFPDILKPVKSAGQPFHLFPVLRRGILPVAVGGRNQVHAGEEAAVLDGRPPAEAVRDVSAALLGSRQHDFARRTGVIVEHRIGTHEAAPQIPVDAFGGGRQTGISGRKVPQKQGGNEQRRKLEHE